MRHQLLLNKQGQSVSLDKSRYTLFFGYWMNNGRFFIQLFDGDLLILDDSAKTPEILVRKMRRAGYCINEATAGTMINECYKDAKVDPLHLAELRLFQRRI